ncbi:hypothetical protein TRAPUB_9677 [Trametes pubescens]|uniref:Uncharacterized protein n=1 Tax=Trametes pubescens TaxID=154538 RepID=A0A1M2W1Z5_TRAPU|nr:hypothetical protein TRAPUB_9677 [Trametes pubescens]
MYSALWVESNGMHTYPQCSLHQIIIALFTRQHCIPEFLKFLTCARATAEFCAALATNRTLAGEDLSRLSDARSTPATPARDGRGRAAQEEKASALRRDCARQIYDDLVVHFLIYIQQAARTAVRGARSQKLGRGGAVRLKGARPPLSPAAPNSKLRLGN